MNKEEFIREVEKLGIEINENKLKLLEEYYNLLIIWNEKINLTAITKKEDVYLKHFYDSLTITKNNYVNFNDSLKICDVGTGAGFPGIVLKIFFPNLDITLVDSLNKRIVFLNEIIEKLDLKKIKCVHDRAENYAKIHREEYDVVTSRAVANLRILTELCIPMVKENGFFIPMKSNINEELKESKRTIEKLDCSIIEINTFTLPIENSLRNILIIKKIKITNKKYPRDFDKIKKYPL